jgi:hypothetical protein
MVCSAGGVFAGDFPAKTPQKKPLLFFYGHLLTTEANPLRKKNFQTRSGWFGEMLFIP